ncbi:hypothetical protein DFQ26_009797 [Actinomortierella ambigua]|nr:hypothetical protein DFQ26_009797 [Actinomortierella ambigua]
MMEYLLPLWLRQYWLERQRRGTSSTSEIPSDIAAHFLQTCAEALSTRDPLTLETPRTCSIQQSFNIILETQRQRNVSGRSAEARRFPFYKASSSAPSPGRLSTSSSSSFYSSSFTTPATLLTMEPSDLDRLNPQEIIRLVVYFVKKSRLEYVDPETCELIHLQGETLDYPTTCGHASVSTNSTLVAFDVAQSVLHSSQHPLNRPTKALLLVAIFCAANIGTWTPSNSASPTELSSVTSRQESLPLSPSSPSSSPSLSPTSPRSRSTPQPNMSFIAAKWIAKLGQALFGFPCAHAGHTHHRRTRASIELMERQRAELDSQLLQAQQQQQQQPLQHHQEDRPAGSPVSTMTATFLPLYSYGATPLSATTTNISTASASSPNYPRSSSPRAEKWCRHCSRAMYLVLAAAKQYKETWLQEFQQDSGIDIRERGQRQPRRQRRESSTEYELAPIHAHVHSHTTTTSSHQTRLPRPHEYAANQEISPIIVPHQKHRIRPGEDNSEDSDPELALFSIGSSSSSSELFGHHPLGTLSIPLSIPPPPRSSIRNHHNHAGDGSTSGGIHSSDVDHRTRMSRSMMDKEISMVAAEEDSPLPMTRLERDLAEAFADSTPRCRSAPPVPTTFPKTTAVVATERWDSRIGQRGRRTSKDMDTSGNNNTVVARKEKARARSTEPLANLELDLTHSAVNKRRAPDIVKIQGGEAFSDEGQSRKDTKDVHYQEHHLRFRDRTATSSKETVGPNLPENDVVDESQPEIDEVLGDLHAIGLQERAGEGDEEEGVKDTTVLDSEALSTHSDSHPGPAEVKRHIEHDHEPDGPEAARGDLVGDDGSRDVGEKDLIEYGSFQDTYASNRSDHQHHLEGQTNLSCEPNELDMPVSMATHRDLEESHLEDDDGRSTPEYEFTEQQLLERRQEQPPQRRGSLPRRKRLVDDKRRKQEQLERIKARLEVKALGKIGPIVSFWEEKGVLEQKSIDVEEVAADDEGETATPGPGPMES